MNQTVRPAKQLTASELSIRTLKPRAAAQESTEVREQARVVVVTAW
ncbi:MAG: hypothetical protein JWN48_2665 [Myxococcaceae bacterium]|nr:hypothetical protein [Myxococcaceae bacterium]